jgi:putative hydrolase of the HAD superfamily
MRFAKFALAAKKRPPTEPRAREANLTEQLEPIEAVIFDFGGVLCEHPAPARFDPIAHLLAVDAVEFRRAFWKNRIAYDAGLDAEEYWSSLVDGMGGTWDPARLPELLELEIGLWSNFDERMLEFAAHLQARGFGTAILSNLPKPLGEALRATPGFLTPFDHHTFSYELGMVKPAAAIYEHTVNALGVASLQALFLDDRPENVEGARKAGLQAELYEQWSDLEVTIAPRYGLPLPDVARRQ